MLLWSVTIVCMQIERTKPKKEIPPYAKKVFSGAIFDIFQWEVKTPSGQTEIHEVARRKVDSVRVLPITDDGKILLTKQEQPSLKPFIAPLGGRMEEGETPLETAKRELLEESGYAANRYELLDAPNPWEKVDWVSYVFIAKDIKKVDKQNLDPGEKINLIEVTFDEFMDIITKPNFRDRETAFFLLVAKEDPERFKQIKEMFKP